MRKPFVAGNWKMHLTSSGVEALLREFTPRIADLHGVDVAVCPPFPYLMTASRLLEGSRVLLGAQNMAWEEKGAFTGEVAAPMLKDAGCTLVILGHSERRHVFGETNDTIQKKVRMALDAGLNPIVCVGETLEEREAGKTESVVEEQIKGCLGALNAEDMQTVTVAYEPVWAIGTGRTATPDQAQEVHGFIREWLNRTLGRGVGDTVRIQYGGSVKPENAAELMGQPDIDGALVGGASLQAESFAAIIEAAA